MELAKDEEQELAENPMLDWLKWSKTHSRFSTSIIEERLVGFLFSQEKLNASSLILITQISNDEDN